MADKKVIDEKQVPEVEPVSPEAEVTPEVTEPAALTEERVQQMIVEATVEAVTAAKESGRRELQSQQSRNKAEVAEAQGRARFAEGSLARVKRGYVNLDPEARQTLENAERDGQLSYYQSRDAEASQRERDMATVDAFEENIRQSIVRRGIDPNDKRIEWGDRTTDLTQRQNAILQSVDKIQEEGAKSDKEKRGQEVKDVETRLRKELGLDSIDTSSSGGVRGKLTKEAIEKMSPEEVAKNYEEINKFYGT